MYCTSCGAQNEDTARFCPMCGRSATGDPGPQAAYAPPPPGGMKRLVRTMADKKIAGVCGGIAQYFEVDPTLVRIVALVAFLAYGVGLLAYIVGWIAMPRDTDAVARTV